MEVLRKFAKTIQDKNMSWMRGSELYPRNRTTLFVNNQKIVFPFPSQEELARLYQSAEPATFGLANQAVLDPTYRSARTLTSENFAINLHPESNLLNEIHQLMLETKKKETNSRQSNSTQSTVRAELYRVNIYGPGDFFREHQDTPQKNKSHFGSLVFCLPTNFQGVHSESVQPTEKIFDSIGLRPTRPHQRVE